MAHGTVTTKAFAIDFVDGGRALYAEIVIDCPECGRQVIRVAGHHLKAIRDFCLDTIDAYPELTGKEPVRATHEQFTLAGGGGDPSQN